MRALVSLDHGKQLKTAVFSLLFLCLLLGECFGQGALIDLRRPIAPPLPSPIVQPLHSYCIKSLDVNVNLNGQVARVQVSQEFKNTSKRTIEASFVFPLPYDGAIDRLTLLVGNKEYEAKLIDRDEARRIFEGYVRRNQDPALLEWMGSGMFKTSVFPIPPGETRKVTIRYSQVCRQFQGMTEWLFPLRIARHTTKPIEQLSVQVSISSSLAIKSVYSPTHSIAVKKPSPKIARISYEQKNVIPNSDFRLFYDVGKQSIGTSVLSYRPDGDEDGYFMMLISPDIQAQQRENISKNVVFVVDRSGSMTGRKIDQAKEALRFVINNLNDGDLFNIVAYDSEIETFAPELQRQNKSSRDKALGFIESIFAGGSTNIDGALNAALDMLQDDETPNYVVFLTDGIPTVGETNIARIVDNAAKANSVRARVCCFGVGYDVNSLLLDKLARTGYGQSVYVRPDEDIEAKVAEFYTRIASPVLTDVKLRVDVDGVKIAQGSVVNRVYPRNLYDLFAGDQLVLVGRYKHAGNAKVVLSGRVNGEVQRFEFPAKLEHKSTSSNQSFVEKLWAVRRIGEIIDKIDLEGRNDELLDELVMLSRRHGVLTPYTSFLADENGAIRDVAQSRLRAATALNELVTEEAGQAGFARRQNKAAFQNAGGGRLGDTNGDGLLPSQSVDAEGGVVFRDAVTNRAVKVKTLKQVGGKSFFLEEGQWVDSNASQEQVETAQDLTRYSSSYFALAAKHGAVVGRILALPGTVIVVIDGQVYRLIDAE
ncbi:MAG TPA: VWA domain-containing protein [Planctomycetaceae bacterium]|nr:VWA domain-containing protein [Planctomycetaceae bacterium]